MRYLVLVLFQNKKIKIISKMNKLISSLWFGCILCVITTHADKKNVLFLVSDDMRPELGAYVGPDFPSPIHPNMHTPNLDGLASRSLLLKRAYVQQALCSPSRTSVLTGRRPDTTHTYDLTRYFREMGGDFVTLPQYFKQNGYETVGIGKIFHPGRTSGNDDPISWTQPYYHADDGKWGKYGALSWYAVNDSLLEKDPLQDMKLANRAVESLKNLSAKALSGEKPFFLAVGFHRPHLPWLTPASFFDLYPLDDIRLPDNPYAPINMPEIAWSGFRDLRSYEDMKHLGHGSINTTFPDHVVKTLRRAYYASVSYTDSLVGQVLTTLKELGLDNSTVVSFWGDHGWNLGEHGEWCKHNNFETSTHAPLMIRVPGLTDHGVVTEALTEFVDIYPTVVEAAGLKPIPLCPENSSKVPVCTEGVSMMPLIKNPTQPWKKAVFSQYPRGDICGSYFMGYSMRTDQYRFARYVVFDTDHNFKPLFHSLELSGYNTELYDHNVDPAENVNRIGHAHYSNVTRALGEQLQAGWRHALPPHVQGKK